MKRNPIINSCVIMLALTAGLRSQPYGLDTRPAFTAYNGTLPTTAPTFSGSWSAVPAFPNVTLLDTLGVTELPGQPSNQRRMVAWEREGRVYSFPKSSSASNADKLLMLDITNKCQGWDDSGLLALAFHPNFGNGPTNNRYVFIYYTWVTPGTVQGSATVRPPTFKPNHDRLSRFTVNLDGTIDPASETIFIDQVSQSVWHNGGGMFFHPDNGFLYLTNGDDAQSSVNTQIINRGLYSGVIRIDVDQRGGSISHPIPRQPLPAGSLTQNYFVPNDNPFVGQANVMEELFCIGLRSPHRMTCDPVSKRIFIGDVGLATWEEVDVINDGESGLNFQWDRVEGNHGDLVQPYIGINRRPIIDYNHSEGTAVIGGYVYRGAEFASDLAGRYIFGDNGSGIIYYLNEATSPATKVPLCTLPLGSGPSSGSNYVGLSSFGLDTDGELYMCQMSSQGGRIYKLSRTGTVPPALPATLSATGLLDASSFTNGNTPLPNTSFINYDVINPLWSDRAVKTRWFAIPDGQQINFAATGDWNFPNGSVMLKHFSLPVDDGNPATLKRLETRVLVRDGEGHVYGMTYKWRPDNTDADLVTSGITEEVPVTGNVDLGTLTSTDIGSPQAGSTVPLNGGYAVTGGGTDIFGTDDSFRYVASQKTGDFDIATRIESVDNANLYTKAGLMVRESLAANARNIMALVFPTTEARNNNTGGYEFQSRDTTGGTSSAIYPASPQPAVRYPNAWLRLKRAGNVFTAYYSRNGTDWSLYATKTLALPGTVYFGMAVTSHTAGALATANFYFNINRTQPWYFPGRQDCLACHTNNTGGVLGVNTQISDKDKLFSQTGVTDNQLRAWNHAGYLNTGLSEGAFEATIPGLIKMSAMNDTSASAQDRMRSYLDSNCAHCHRPGGVHAFWDARIEASLGSAGIINGIVQDTLGISGGKVLVPQSVEQSIMYQRLATATAHYKMPPLAKNVVDQTAVGLIQQWIAEAVQPPADPLPLPWVHADIGSVGQNGDATYAGTTGTFIMSASGDDIWGNADAFHFAYQPFNGDGEIIARVQSLTSTDAFTKAGVMIRESLDAGSKNAMVALTSSQGAQLQYRASTNGESSYTDGPNQFAPYYVRLRRQGDVLTGYIAYGNGAWQQIGSVTLPMNQSIFVGLATTAHNNAQTATALFDNVTVINGALPLELHVNFQLAGAPVPEGSLADTGEVFGSRGNGFSYGWNADNTADARDRNNGASPDQRYDTLIHMQRLPADPAKSWEIAVPNGTYSVHLVAGDPSTFDSTHVVEAEGIQILSGAVSSSSPFIETTSNVTVTDGALTLTQGATGSNTKLCYIDITAVQGAVLAKLAAPAHQSTYYGAAAATVNLSASASTTNSGATITSVEFYDGFTLIGSDSTTPFELAWSNPSAGIHHVMAKATDSTGASGFSTFADITVNADGAFGLEAEYWPNLTMSGTPITRNDSNVQFDWATGTPMTGIPNDNFSVRWRGRIKAPVTGTYTFKTATDDGTRLWVDGQLLVDRWINQGASPAYTGTINLVAGTTYEFEMQYFENYGNASALLSWSVPSLITEQPVPATSLLVPTANTNHRPRQPDILIPTIDGELTDPIGIVMQTGAFQDQDAGQIHTASDWEIWTDTAPQLVWSATNQTGAALTYATLANGSFANGFTALSTSTNYQLRVRHQDNSSDTNTAWSPYAVRNFTTTPPDDPRGVLGEYYPATQRLSGTPLTRTDATVNFTYGNGEPFTGVGTDNFSVRWRARVKPQFTETYTFTTETDDGARLWVNGVQLVDKWIGQGATRWSGTITLIAGQYYDLEMQYFDGQFGASAKLYWSSPSQPEQIIPALRLYAIANGANHRPLVPNVASPAVDGSAQDSTTIAMQSSAFEDEDVTDTHATTDWEIWTDEATPTRIWSALNQTGTKRLNALLSDGVFEGSHTGLATLIPESNYKLRLRHQDSSADSNSEWSAWSDFRTFTASSASVPHGLQAEYYDNTQTFQGTPLQRVDANIDFNWAQGSPMVGIGVDNFVVRWRGRVKPEFSETYTFTTVSDDGARVWVNGQLIVDAFVYQGTTAHSGTITLEAGQFYDIEMDYLEGGFDANAQLRWSSASRGDQVIPGSRLYLPLPGANHRPRSPDIISPTGTVSAATPALQSGAFTDLDPGDAHAATDWEIWTTDATPQRVWSALNRTGSQRLTVSLPLGIFENSLLSHTTLNWSTTYQLRIRHQDNSGDANSEWSAFSTQNFTTQAAPWSGWRSNEFTADELLDPAISGPNADPDHDGLPNLLEYAFRTTPKTPHPQQHTVQRTGGELLVDYPQNVDATDITMIVEYSDDLVNWSSSAVTYEALSTTATVRFMRAHVPVNGGTAMFARIRVTMP